MGPREGSAHRRIAFKVHWEDKMKKLALICQSRPLCERQSSRRRSGTAAAITLGVPARTMVIGIASGTTTMTIDIIAGDTTATSSTASTATDAFVRGASRYRTASASRIVATEIHSNEHHPHHVVSAL